jgi:pimeloyl-ACP methyl ester carboxylesterase
MTASTAVLLALAATAALLALAGLHYAFWTWRLRAPGGEDELLRAPTRDGWRIALAHRRPRATRREPPVLLCHGIAVNRLSLDFGVERYSLSAYLARAGFDCFAMDLRGHGDSLPDPGASRRWTLDTYLREDIPAALDAVRAATGADRVLWVGHSQGAILGMAACSLYPDRIAGVVSIAGPAHFHAQPQLARLVGLRFVLGRFTRLAARMVAPFAGTWHPTFAELAIYTRNVERPVYRRLLANVLENLQPGVLDQFEVFVREDSFRSLDGRTDYRSALGSCRQPALFLSAEKDGLAPPEVVEASFREWGGPKRYWNFGHDYGHTDLLLGRNAPEVVFPVVRDFLLECSRSAQATGCRLQASAEASSNADGLS